MNKTEYNDNIGIAYYLVDGKASYIEMQVPYPFPPHLFVAKMPEITFGMVTEDSIPSVPVIKKMVYTKGRTIPGYIMTQRCGSKEVRHIQLPICYYNFEKVE